MGLSVGYSLIAASPARVSLITKRYDIRGLSAGKE